MNKTARGKKIFALLGFSLLLLLLWQGRGALTLEHLRENREQFRSLLEQNPVLFPFLLFLFYVAIAGFSIPGAAAVTLVIGSLLGFWEGLALVSFASSVGATIAFLLARFFLRDWVEERFQGRVKGMLQEFERGGVSYLAFLRLVPLFPFFLVNLVAGLSRIPVFTFYLTSQVAMLPGTAILVNAGKEISRIENVSDLFGPRIIISLSLLGVFPLVVRALWRKKSA